MCEEEEGGRVNAGDIVPLVCQGGQCLGIIETEEQNIYITLKYFYKKLHITLIFLSRYMLVMYLLTSQSFKRLVSNSHHVALEPLRGQGGTPR